MRIRVASLLSAAAILIGSALTFAMTDTAASLYDLKTTTLDGKPADLGHTAAR